MMQTKSNTEKKESSTFISTKNETGSNLKAEKKEFSQVLRILFGLIAMGLLLLILMSLYILAPEGVSEFTNVLFHSSIFIMIGFSALLMGFFVGFIFAIPKENSISSAKNIEQYLNNDNLVQISDWLTKIIVGVGLTQIYVIPSFLIKLARYFSSFLALDEINGFLYGNVLVAAILYFLFLGFLISYYWTRLKYKLLLTVTDDDIDEIIEEKEKEIEVKNEIISQKDEMIENIQTAINSTGIIIKDQSSTDKNDEEQKGKWGGLSERNGRKVEAKVWSSSLDHKLFHVELSVSSTEPTKPLEGEVKFHLHPTYNTSEPVVESENGIAILNIIAWKAFIVGVTTDNGETQLEIDLSGDDIDAPKNFKEL